MGKTKKLIELDNRAIEVLEKQAKLQKRSLKNYLEFLIENTALNFSEPSEEYKAMMDDLLERQKNGTLETIPIDEIRKKYGISRKTVD
ncbi:hypothetical protein EI546_08640 [Aequorivita sp. H23M31]|uniref:Uncharacterized protein n=2 Tax=Aequorivita ciconiae TaxID=2494375 RepID=A0A410G7H4_9FLAO|nr:hypothetical protein EI546_08640 [Aequorivita sp. H23M31]